MWILVFLFGLCLTAIGVYLRYSTTKLKRVCNAPIDGILTGYEIKKVRIGKTGSSYRLIYYPVVSYSVNGDEYKHTFTAAGYGEPVIQEGEKITLLINRDNPKQCYAVNEKVSFNIILHIILIIMGSFAMLIGALEFSLIFKTLFVLVSLILIINGMLKWLRGNKLRRHCTSQTNGIIENSNGKTEYTVPLFIYTVDGVKYSINRGIKFKVEESIAIFYNPYEPSEHYEASKKPSFTSGFFSMIMGVLLLLLFYLFQN
jgi:hypothetical protein